MTQMIDYLQEYRLRSKLIGTIILLPYEKEIMYHFPFFFFNLLLVPATGKQSKVEPLWTSPASDVCGSDKRFLFFELGVFDFSPLVSWETS